VVAGGSVVCGGGSVVTGGGSVGGGSVVTGGVVTVAHLLLLQSLEPPALLACTW